MLARLCTYCTPEQPGDDDFQIQPETQRLVPVPQSDNCDLGLEEPQAEAHCFNSGNKVQPSLIHGNLLRNR